MSESFTNHEYEISMGICNQEQLRFGFDKIDDIVVEQWVNMLLCSNGVYPILLEQMTEHSQHVEWKKFYQEYCGLNQNGR